ncbi:site-specific DNA-methyltransferase, partial [Glutamicibacter sp. BW78]|uniref:DNA methyltransferase n=1 Tax=Glutamicibacter sp. BW78 TaxID=2024403 RepID=UPI000BB97074
IQMVTDVINPRAGVARPGAFTRSEEYIYYVLIGDSSGIVPAPLSSSDATLTTKNPPIWFSLMRTGSNSARRARPNLFYPVWIDPAGRIHSVGDSISLATDRHAIEAPSPELIALWPIRPNGDENTWQLGPSALRAALAEGTARVKSTGTRHTMNYLRTAEKKRISAGEIEVLGKDERGALILKHKEGVVRLTAPRSVWTTGAHDAGLYGSSMVSALLPRQNFPFPKSLYAVEDALRFFVAPKPNAVVLDFFSGSGTTTHAVMRLNKQDGGHRQCISVTNNEVSAEEQSRLRKQGLRPGDSDWEALGICDYVTKPRITAALTGETPQGDSIKGNYRFTDEFPMAEGFEENAAYFTLTYEAPLSVRHNRAFKRIASMLWMRAGSRGRIITDLGTEGWDVAEAYAVLENLDQIDAFIASLKQTVGVELAFIVTDDDSAFQMVCRELPGTVTAVRLYESYLQNFQINTGRGL